MEEIKTLSDLARLVQKNMEELRAHKQEPEPPEPEPEPEKKEPEKPEDEPRELHPLKLDGCSW